LESWSSWLVFLKATYGLELADATELAIFTKHTGRSVYAPPLGGFAEVVCITGRQSGKTRIAGLIADNEAITAHPEADKTETYVLLLAQDQRSAIRALFGYAKAPFERVPALQAEVFSVTADTIKLAHGVNICAYPCRPAAVRGLCARVVICDELGFFTSTENIPTDKEMLRAV
jgi:phage terminase large subunit-like protein